MPLAYPRSIRFRDTDAAGVVYFSRLLEFCHDAYEASLADFGLELRQWFGGESWALPIARAEVDFWQPLAVGDRALVSLTPHPTLGRAVPGTSGEVPPLEVADGFEIAYRLDWAAAAAEASDPIAAAPPRPIARARTGHACIDIASRRRRPLPDPVRDWLAWAIAEAEDNWP